MNSHPQNHHRRSIRLRGNDYTRPGAYFVTICTYQRQNLFGEIKNGVMVPNARGEIVRREWFRTAELRPYIELTENEFVVMPNHVHGIIRVWGDGVGALPRSAQSGAEQRSAPTKSVAAGSLGAIVRGYKSAVTYAINALENSRGAVVWQSNYCEHIIRNDREWNAIGWYIANNPGNWQLDRDNLQNTTTLLPAEMVAEYLQDAEEMGRLKL